MVTLCITVIFGFSKVIGVGFSNTVTELYTVIDCCSNKCTLQARPRDVRHGARVLLHRAPATAHSAQARPGALDPRAAPHGPRRGAQEGDQVLENVPGQKSTLMFHHDKCDQIFLHAAKPSSSISLMDVFKLLLLLPSIGFKSHSSDSNYSSDNLGI